MIGRGIFGNPWVFAGRAKEDTSRDDKLAALLSFARDFEKLQPAKSFHLVRKHVKAFTAGFEGSAQLRAALMETQSADDMERVIKEAA
jgi:tRNA-dihydrouridine synthase